MGDYGGYKIGAVALRTGLSPTALRMWEEHHGLLHPRRSEGGTRLYSEADVLRILEIKKLTSEGHSLHAIGQVLDKSQAEDPGWLAELFALERSLPGTEAIRSVARSARSFIEAVKLREISSAAHLREGRVLQQTLSAVSRAHAAASLDAAATVLVTAAVELTGAPRTAVAFYDSPTDSLHFRLVHSGTSAQITRYRPLPVDSVQPPELRDAVRHGQSFYAPDVHRNEPSAGGLNGPVPDQIRSLFVSPMTVGSDLVGAMSLASPKVDGIPSQARDAVKRLGDLSAPAIAYFLTKSRVSGAS